MIRQFRTFDRPEAIWLGTEAFSSGAAPAAALNRLGLMPLCRTPVGSWAEIETSPGVYDWTKGSGTAVIEAHRVLSQAVVPLRLAGAVPGFYPASITHPTTRSAALAFITAYASHLDATAGSFILTIDPRVQETVFTAKGIPPDDWAALFADLAPLVRGSAPGALVLPSLVGDNHSSYLPGAWLSTVAAAADGLGIEETAPLVQTVLSDIDWFHGEAAGNKIWLLGSSFATWTGVDPRAHGTEAQQGQYFTDLMNALLLGYAPKVQAVVQVSLADAGPASTWSDHLGLTTPGMAADKIGLSSYGYFVRHFPAYHTVFQYDRTIQMEELGQPVDLSVFSLTDFEYLEWKGLVDLSQVTAVPLHVGIAAPDGYPGYLLQIGASWRSIPSADVDILPWVQNGDVTFKVAVPIGQFTGLASVNTLTVSPTINPGLPDLYPPVAASVTIGKRLTVEFTDTLHPPSATDPSHYTIQDVAGLPLPIVGVTLADPTHVQVVTERQKIRTYRLIISGVEDESGNAMPTDTLTFKGAPESPPPPTPLRPINVAATPAPGGLEIQLRMESDAPARVMIFDVSGRQVAERTAEAGGSREWSWHWNGATSSGRRAAPGVYFIRATSAGGSAATRAILAR